MIAIKSSNIYCKTTIIMIQLVMLDIYFINEHCILSGTQSLTITFFTHLKSISNLCYLITLFSLDTLFTFRRQDSWLGIFFLDVSSLTEYCFSMICQSVDARFAATKICSFKVSQPLKENMRTFELNGHN